jgi:hypothetical protein
MVDINTVRTKTASDVYTRASTEHTCTETSWPDTVKTHHNADVHTYPLPSL